MVRLFFENIVKFYREWKDSKQEYRGEFLSRVDSLIDKKDK